MKRNALFQDPALSEISLPKLQHVLKAVLPVYTGMLFLSLNLQPRHLLPFDQPIQGWKALPRKKHNGSMCREHTKKLHDLTTLYLVCCSVLKSCRNFRINSLACWPVLVYSGQICEGHRILLWNPLGKHNPDPAKPGYSWIK